MKHARIEAHEDHLVIRLDTLQSVGAMRRTVLVPYSTIAEARVAEPKWPAFISLHNGPFVPGVLALGTFVGDKGKRRFVDIGRDTRAALTLRLQGHPDFDEVEVDARDAEPALAEIGRHAAGTMARPPVFE